MKKIHQLIFVLIKRLLMSPRVIDVCSPEVVKGEVVVITGASQGLGKDIAIFLTKLGAKVVVLARSSEKLIQLTKEYPQITAIQCDVTQNEQVQKTMKQIISSFGKIDVLINNAGKFLDKDVTDYTTNDIDSLVSTNITALFYTTAAVVQVMKKKHQGLIINIGSKISHNSHVAKHKVGYATTKYAVEGFSQSLRNELKGTGIRVTCLLPATIATFPSLQFDDYLATQEIAATIAHLMVQKHTSFEHILLHSIDQDL